MSWIYKSLTIEPVIVPIEINIRYTSSRVTSQPITTVNITDLLFTVHNTYKIVTFPDALVLLEGNRELLLFLDTSEQKHF